MCTDEYVKQVCGNGPHNTVSSGYRQRELDVFADFSAKKYFERCQAVGVPVPKWAEERFLTLSAEASR